MQASSDGKQVGRKRGRPSKTLTAEKKKVEDAEKQLKSIPVQIPKKDMKLLTESEEDSSSIDPKERLQIEVTERIIK